MVSHCLAFLLNLTSLWIKKRMLDALDIKSTKKTVLIIDAEPHVEQDLRMTLSEQGYEVLSARNLKEAAGRFDLNTFDLLLLDLDVPRTQSRTTLLNPGPPVIGLTERSDLGSQMINAPRFKGMAEKPIDMTSLLNAIADVLSRDPGSSGFSHVPARTSNAREKSPSYHSPTRLFSAAYRGWGINE